MDQQCQQLNLEIAVPIAKAAKSGHRIIAKRLAHCITNRGFILTDLYLLSVWGRCRGNIKKKPDYLTSIIFFISENPD